MESNLQTIREALQDRNGEPFSFMSDHGSNLPSIGMGVYGRFITLGPALLRNARGGSVMAYPMGESKEGCGSISTAA